MPFSLKRVNAANPKLKEWKSHQPDPTSSYVEVVKYKTRARAEQVAAEWGGSPEVVEVPWGAGEEESSYPNY